jgi:hypothetical protein
MLDAVSKNVLISYPHDQTGSVPLPSEPDTHQFQEQILLQHCLRL